MLRSTPGTPGCWARATTARSHLRDGRLVVVTVAGALVLLGAGVAAVLAVVGAGVSLALVLLTFNLWLLGAFAIDAGIVIVALT
jgi:hypothetical protein